MELKININIEELITKQKDLDLVKIMVMWKDLNAGKEVVLLDGMLKFQKVEDKNDK